MSQQEKQLQVLALLEGLTSLSHESLPVDQRGDLPKSVGILPRGTLFSCFHEVHLKEATVLYQYLHDAKDFDEFIKRAKLARDTVNEGLFTYSLSVALLHRDDCKGVHIPPIQEIFPDRFIPAETINLARKEVYRNPKEDIVVPVEKTGNILDPEYKLAYYREDIETNAHHWHWHIVYPATWDAEKMGHIKDRKGELFYYMHQQMCARYDCERLSNGMNRMIPFHNFEEKLEGYAPHLISLVSGLQYGARPQGFSLRDLKDVDVQSMERWRERIIEAIQLGYVIDEHGEHVNLDEEHGADIIGALIESSHDSKNSRFYGSLHNWGHVMMARMHDPDGRYQENPGVMSDTSTSLRDPIFYRWHRFVDNIFKDYKSTLHPYEKEEYSFDGIEVLEVTVKAKTDNVLTTFLKEDILELTHGINLGTTHSVKVTYDHLDHEPFHYSIDVQNKTGATKEATVRIFLGPKYDELGNVLIAEDKRRLMIELDKFHKTLAPGKNTISRNSVDSSVTVSHVPTFDELKSGGVAANNQEYCSCGWPGHMLIPRGTRKGMDFHLYVVLTDWEKDKVNGGDKMTCADAVSYCGALDHKYPDKRPMGFPFDRPVVDKTEEELTAHVSNLHRTDVKIKFLS
uniref:Hemocyanin subunit g n=1 Tax=Mastigoproctus giganteus TaxID=58767 RepID=G8YZS4_MASGI|nr:hemocyanin subunit g [Mastigoproctus giganteus]